MSKPQPPLELRIGRIKAAIWADEAGRKTYHSVSFSRLYRTEVVGSGTSTAFAATTSSCSGNWPTRPTLASSSSRLTPQLAPPPIRTRKPPDPWTFRPTP